MNVNVERYMREKMQIKMVSLGTLSPSSYEKTPDRNNLSWNNHQFEASLSGLMNVKTVLRHLLDLKPNNLLSQGSSKRQIAPFPVSLFQ